ncbi:MAG TPA: GYF domain-containing protein [Tepidisphaeraceae bacterium]|jgi:hypothetical protein|nr:GYF domain-containing protein [Tepidisphaeraceae bacterium]
MSDTSWYFSQGGAQQGPVPLAQLQQMAAAGQLRPTDLVWQAAMPQWTPAGNVPALFGTGAAPPTLPVLPVGYFNPAAPQGPRQPNIGDDAGMRMLLPVGRSGWAIAAGYMGLFALFPFCSVLFGPLAIIFGSIALRDIKRNPSRHGKGRAIFGLIAGSIGVVMSVGLLVASPFASHWMRRF